MVTFKEMYETEYSSLLVCTSSESTSQLMSGGSFKVDGTDIIVRDRSFSELCPIACYVFRMSMLRA